LSIAKLDTVHPAVKVKGKVIEHYAMKAYGGEDV
jgi:hypothetical protein